MKAWSVAAKVAKILNDDDNIRCTVEELAMWFNSANLQIVNLKPDTLTGNGDISLVAGTKQSAASVTVGGVTKTGLRLLDVIRNVGTYKRAVAVRERRVLDTTMPNWHGSTANAEVKFFMFDERDPLTFYNYPPQPSGTTSKVEGLVSLAPTPVTKAAADAQGFLGDPDVELSNVYEGTIIDLMLARALAKDSKIIGNMQRAQAHFAAAATSLGQKVQSDKFFAPTDGFSPNVSQGQ
ncbi:hypothetical protein UFOVP1419_45 [uncultured Caudovirales phage]|uniref:Uncharacterized protein n=1 Tax=uncultured Caudovirales phage TaxID=2100421 RepID=A0A6J5SE86_9CAUD|nr:hypothetical protein UFOVP1419_45 [uncultured Caudovirales phage]